MLFLVLSLTQQSKCEHMGRIVYNAVKELLLPVPRNWALGSCFLKHRYKIKNLQ